MRYRFLKNVKGKSLYQLNLSISAIWAPRQRSSSGRLTTSSSTCLHKPVRCCLCVSIQYYSCNYSPLICDTYSSNHILYDHCQTISSMGFRFSLIFSSFPLESGGGADVEPLVARARAAPRGQEQCCRSRTGAHTSPYQ